MQTNLHPPRLSWRLRLGILALLLAGLGTAGVGIASRMNHEKDLQREVERQAVRAVEVISPLHGPGQQALTLPGNVAAYVEAPIYARVNGYLKRWYPDIGAHVKAGQLLAEIETPELDQQIHRAEADLATAQANYELAKSTALRWQNLLATDSVSHQEADEKVADEKAKQTIMNAVQANLDSLRVQQSFNRIVAPFSGVITDRKTDIGQLVNAGSNGSQPLFKMADISKLRAYVEVPQSYAAMIKPGLAAELAFPEMPSRRFHATLTSTSNAVHENSRTLTVELQMENREGAMLSGTYAEVHFALPSNQDVLRLPASALLFRKNGMEVATVTQDGHVRLKSIKLGRDLGGTVEVVNGLEMTDQVIDNPSDSLANGDAVKVLTASQPMPAVERKPGLDA
jgi:RND family efflux transporter MFP subunit